MDIFEEYHLNLNKKLLTIIGVWPYSKARTRIMLKSFFMGVMVILAIPQLTSVIVHYEDVDRLILSLLAFLTAMSTCFKMLAMLMTGNEMRALCESIADNWIAIKTDNERQILYEYSETGRKLTIFTAIFYATAGTSMSMAPLILKILDRIYPLGEPRPNVYLLEGEFFIDRDEHFLKLVFCDAIMCIVMCTLVIGIDSMYIVSSQHCCALYAIVRYRLLNLHQKIHDNSPTTEIGHSYDWMILTIELHQKALRFTSTLENAFSMAFLFIMTMFIVLIPLSACAILANLHSMLTVYPYIVVFVAFSINVFILCWPGQIIVNHQRSLYVDAYCNEWYTIPVRARKLLLTFMLRCSKPATLTAAGILEINFELYSNIMRTAVSYITVMESFR